MQSESVNPKNGAESKSATKPLLGSHSTTKILMIVILFVGYTTGFFTRSILVPGSLSAGKVAMPMELDKGLPLAQAYHHLEQQVAELSHQADQSGSPSLGQAVQRLAQEIRELRTLNPYYQFKEIKAATIPAGVPLVYGNILQVSFDQVETSIVALGRLDPTYGVDKITLKGSDLERYIRVGQQTACRYCCNVQTLVFANGEAACQCEHSKAMRGLAAYLITEQGDRYSDEELVAELNKWRAVYFPKQTLTETLGRMKQAGAPGIDEIATEFPEFMPDMVGAC